jgi:hypothetical protein
MKLFETGFAFGLEKDTEESENGPESNSES